MFSDATAILAALFAFGRRKGQVRRNENQRVGFGRERVSQGSHAAILIDSAAQNFIDDVIERTVLAGRNSRQTLFQTCPDVRPERDRRAPFMEIADSKCGSATGNRTRVLRLRISRPNP